ncbi:MAG: CRISPR-associated helicase Cas3' [Elusimicrobia bacterium]|nr:CRISPR-associated helicase Cas3' [Elusimicrobiota bacterium]
MSETKYYAHTKTDPDGYPAPQNAWQPLKDHLLNVAALSRRFAEEARPGDKSFASAAEAAGLLHDLGKYSIRFQQRLKDSRVCGIEHWLPGAAILYRSKLLHSSFSSFAHHVGLLNIFDIKNSLSAPSASVPETDEELYKLFLAECSRSVLSLKTDNVYTPSQNTLLTKIIFSCLVDADFLDTEKHFEPEAAECRVKNKGRLKPGDWQNILAKKTELLSASSSPANKARRVVLEACLNAADKKPGLFSLTAPTGSGKTLSSLAFALKHIRSNPALRRIVVVLPYTTIIEQTAEEYGKIVGAKNLLEHHSAKDLEKDSDEERRYRLAAENWDAPVIVTTQVQFFESLFSNKPSSCRKLHRIANSVIIFDEVQTLTGYLLRPLLNMVNELCRTMGCTALMCTATPNCLGLTAGKLGIAGWNPQEIINDPSALAKEMKRANILMPVDYSVPSPLSDIASEMGKSKQALCIVNRKDDAEDVFRALPQEGRYHLSTRMCPAHRTDILKKIRSALSLGQICRLSATQCVEAGVDLDFPAVWRALGPLDSILQAAGRCNREGKRALSDSSVKVFISERQPPQGYYNIASHITPVFQQLCHDEDILDPETISKYFTLLLDRIPIDKVFLEDGREARVDELEKNGQFADIAQAVRLIKNDTVQVVVPYCRKGRAAGKYLEKFSKKFGTRPVPYPIRKKLVRVSVQFHKNQVSRYCAQGSIKEFKNKTYFWTGHYDENLGCVVPKPEDTIV